MNYNEKSKKGEGFLGWSKNITFYLRFYPENEYFCR